MIPALTTLLATLLPLVTLEIEKLILVMEIERLEERLSSMDRKQLCLTRSWFSATNVHKRVTLLGSAEQKLVKTTKDHEDAHADEGALKIYGMIAGMESDPDSERKATSEYALMGFTTDKELAYEEKIRILKFDLEDKSNLLAYHEKLVANATQEKQALQAKLDNEIANTANWLQSSKNLVKLIDSL
ncbi:hypothetical protein Tco_0973149, partial [Tanacetum coccineum]